MPSKADLTDLVLGAHGFLGRRLVRRLEADGRRVIAVGRDAGDLAVPEVARSALGRAPVARIFHFATRQRTGPSQYDIQAELLAVNARMHLNVLEAWRQLQPQAKLITPGSSCTYPESRAPLTEASFGLGPLHPSVAGYALAKQVLATGCAAYARQYGLRYLHCVLATTYGPGDHTEADRSHFVGALLHRAAAEKRRGATCFTVWGDPATVREVLHADDQIDAILRADAQFTDTILNCAADTPVTVGAVAGAVLRALDWQVPIERPAESFQGTPYKMLDSGRFLAATGWRPRISLDDGLRQLVREAYP